MQVRHRRTGIDGHARSTSQFMDRLDGAVQVGACLRMYRDISGANSLELFEVPVRINDHEMNVERLFGIMCNGCEHRKSKRNIGYKYPIHNIDMEPIRFALVDHRDVIIEMGKVCG